MTKHNVIFEENTFTGMWRAKCSGCFWFTAGTQERVMEQAEYHDREWVRADPIEGLHHLGMQTSVPCAASAVTK